MDRDHAAMAPPRGILRPALFITDFFGSTGRASPTDHMNWHKRYLQQAAWTRDLRTYLFSNAGTSRAHRVLEVGCGTGVILNDLVQDQSRLDLRPFSVFGLDLASTALLECRRHAPVALLTRADALCLPYVDHAFEITFCHFLLLWLKEPLRALQEMKRVTRKGGHVLVFAEPDYTARVDRPEELIPLGRWQTQALERQGADVALGSHLAQLCDRAGIRIVETGVIESRSPQHDTLEEQEGEWETLQADLANLVSSVDMALLKSLDTKARSRGERILYVPTYYAWGQV